MIRAFDEMVRKNGDGVFFRFADVDAAEGGLRRGEGVITYRQARLAAIALMHQMAREGVRQGDYIASDMDNCPAFVYLILACWYGGFRLITLNHRLDEAGKDERLATVEDATRIAPLLLTEADVHEMISLAREAETGRELVHSAQRAAALSVRENQGVVMFTSGTTGKAKGARLSGDNLIGSARAFNSILGGGKVLWQVCLPLYHIGGLQMVVRSIMGGTPFLLYRKFEAPRVLADAQRFRATHVSVVDKTLRDLMAWADKGVHGGVKTLQAYRCILLGGAAPNPNTIEQVRTLQIPVVSSYGMTETSSLVAFCPVEEDSRMLYLLPGYDACVVDSDDYGRGELGIRGPGLFQGYLGQQLALTADGYFLTGDTGEVSGRSLCIEERTDDMFVSGGENIYPEEIRRRLLEIPGVTDAYVYGAKDATWGRRPVAVVEMANSQVGPGNAVALSRQVHAQARERIARIYQPDRLFAVDAFPRHGIGKIDRVELQRQAECYLDVKRVVLHHIAQPFVTPVKTAKAQLAERESLIVEVFDAEGRSGIGEDVAFSTPWYLPETIDDDLAFLRDQAIPCVLENRYLHPREVYATLAARPGAHTHRMAIAAVETALWDLYGKRAQKTMRQLIGAGERWTAQDGTAACPPGMVPGGVVIGLVPVDEAVVLAKQAFAAGYRRIKLKIAPGDDLKRAHAVRTAVPDAAILLDANQSYTEVDMSTLRRLDALGCAGIEEPLNPRYAAKSRISIFNRLASLQFQMKTTIFLDESIASDDDMREALTTRNIRGYVLKIGKFGGVLPALQFYEAARARGAEVWMGGMYDTGISKRLHAAFSLLPGIGLPGDIGDTSRYFATDITTPPFKLADGMLQLNPPEAPFGLGCGLDLDALASVTLESWEFPAAEGEVAKSGPAKTAETAALAAE